MSVELGPTGVAVDVASAAIGAQEMAVSQSESSESSAPVLKRERGDHSKSSSQSSDVTFKPPHKQGSRNPNQTQTKTSPQVAAKVPPQAHVEGEDGKKRHKRARRPRWRKRPYYKRSGNQEARTSKDAELDVTQEQAKRANWVSQRMQKYGKPFAPYNTTQFLMEDHNVRSPDFAEINKMIITNHKDHSANHGEQSFESHDGPSDSDEFYSSPDDEQDFLQRQFSEVYDNIHAERIGAMSKTELVQEYLLLEQRVEELENKLKEQARSSGYEGSEASDGPIDDRVLHEVVRDADGSVEDPNVTIKRLQVENARLRADNDQLRLQSGTSDSYSSSVTSTPVKPGREVPMVHVDAGDALSGFETPAEVTSVMSPVITKTTPCIIDVSMDSLPA